MEEFGVALASTPFAARVHTHRNPIARPPAPQRHSPSTPLVTLSHCAIDCVYNPSLASSCVPGRSVVLACSFAGLYIWTVVPLCRVRKLRALALTPIRVFPFIGNQQSSRNKDQRTPHSAIVPSPRLTAYLHTCIPATPNTSATPPPASPPPA